MAPNALEVRGLTVEFGLGPGAVRAVDSVDLDLRRGEVHAIVGESGSGKSALLKAVCGLSTTLPGVVAGGVQLRFAGEQRCAPYDGVVGAAARSIGELRGRAARVDGRVAPFRGARMGLVLQNGRAAMDPCRRVGSQLDRAIRAREPGAGAASRTEEAMEWLRALGIHGPARVLASYPHELSGGMAQRAVLAMVLARGAELLFLDEITTGLDVSVQAQLLELMLSLHERRGFSALFVTHDIGLARAFSSSLSVMRRGRVLDRGPSVEIFARASLSDYSARLLDAATLPPARPSSSERRDVLARVVGVSVEYGAGARGLLAPHRRTQALASVSFELRRGEVVAVVGESGSGKTTLARVLSTLLRPSAGEIDFDGVSLSQANRGALRRVCRRIHLLFQNPYTSLNPEISPLAAIEESQRHHARLGRREARVRGLELLHSVGLGHRARTRLGSLSGGERRRVGILIALHAVVDLLILDEPSSSLDAVHRLDVAAMIERARAAAPGRSFVIISHDLAFVRRIADRVLVFHAGRLVEDAPAARLGAEGAVHHPYTEALWRAALFLSEGSGAGQRYAHESRPLSDTGCPYATSCAARTSARCVEHLPELRTVGPEVRVACHEVQDVSG